MAIHYATSSGAGAKDGSTWGNAWAGNAMGNPASGDTVLLGAGTYTGLGPFTSGVTYSAVSSTSIGVGTVAANVSNGTTQQVILPGTSSYNFSAATNCVLTGGLWIPPWKSGGSIGPPTLYGILIHNAPASGNNIIAPGNNNSFINLEISGPAPNSNGYNQTTSQLSAFFGGSNALISGCKVHDMDGPFYYMMGGTVIEYCTIYNVSSDDQISGNPSEPHPDLSYNNQTSVGSSNPFGYVIRYCVFANCVSEGIFFDNFNGVAGGTFINLIMYGNLMFQGDTAGTVAGGASGQCDAIEIKTQAGNFGAFYIYNNTFVDWGVGSKPGLNSDGAGTISHLTAIQNNLFVNTTTQMDTADSGNIIQSNNGYYQATKGDTPADGNPTNLTTSPFPTTVAHPWTFSQASVRSGPAPNTQTRPVPLGYDPTPYIPSFQLAPGSLAAGKSVTLTAPAAGNLGITHTFNVDMFGNSGSNLGAFQGSAAITPAITLPASATLVFNQDFTTGAPLSVSDTSNGSATWYDRTPYGGDFGDADFGTAGGVLGGQYTTTNSTLTIEMYWKPFNNKWQGGLLSSMFPDGHGFTQALGYWEAKILCPPLQSPDPANTTGLWPAFFLSGANGTTNGGSTPNVDSMEIDIIEAYSIDFTQYHTNWHVWRNGTQTSAGGAQINAVVDLSKGYHIYSCWVTSATMHYYLDGVEVFNAPTPPAGQLPLFAMVDSALGGGFADNINQANIYKMLVQYVRCWAMNTDSTAPSVPGSFTAAAGPVVASQVTLSWSASTDNVSPQGSITYSIYQGTAGALIGTTAAGVTSFTQTGLAASTLFQYAITANDQAGNSSLKTATGASTSRTTGAVDATAPTAASALTATAVSNTEIDLAWASATDVPNAPATVSYNIFRALGTSGTFTNIGSVGAGALSFKNTGLSPSTQFTYEIQSKDFAGNLSAGFSNTSTATTTSTSALPTFIQAGPTEFNGTGTVGTSTYASAQVGGDLNVVAIGWNTTGLTVSSVTDTSGNTYIAALATTSTGAFFQTIYYAKNIAPHAAGNVVTVTMSGSASGLNVRILEYSNIDKVNPVDVALGATGTAATASVGPITTTNAVDLLVSAAYTSDVNTGPGPGFTQRILQASGNIVEDELVQAIGSYTATSPAASTVNYVMQIVAFRGANVTLQPPGPIRAGSAGVASVNARIAGFPAGVPGLAQHVATGMERNPMGTFSITLPNPVGAGNCIIFGCQYNANTPSAVGAISDNLGNTWISGISGSNASFSNVNTFYCFNAVAGITKISLATSGMATAGFSSAFQAVISEFYNVVSFDVQSVSTISASPPAVTPTLSGDLIWHWGFDGSDTTVNGGSYNSLTPIAAGAGFTLLHADLQTGSVAQFIVQPIAAPISPSFTKTGAATWESVAIAFKSGLKGTPPIGMYIAHVQHTLLASAAAQGRPPPTSIQFPAQGNLLVGLYDSGDVIINSVIDSGGSTWHIAGTNVGADGGEPTQIVYGQGGTINNGLHGITVSLSGTVTTDCMFVLYDVVGAAASSFDIATNTNGTQSTPGTTLTTSSVTPRTSNGITFSTDSQFEQSMTGSVGAGYIFDSAVNSLNFNDTADGGTQTSTLDEDNGKAHIFNTSLSPVTFTYTYNSTLFPIRSWGSVAAHFSSGAGVSILRPFQSSPVPPSFIQGNKFNSGSGSVSVTSFGGAFASNNTAGNSILAFVFSFQSASPPTVSDSQGNVYTLVSNAVISPGLMTSAYVATNIGAGANTVTASSVGVISNWEMQILEYGPSTVDNAIHNISTSGGTTLTSGNIIAHNNNETLVMYGISDAANTTLTPTGGFTTRVQDALSSWDGTTADLSEAIAGTYSGGFTATTSTNWWVLTVALIPAVVPIGSTGSLGFSRNRGIASPNLSGRSLSNATTIEQTIVTNLRSKALASLKATSVLSPNRVFRPESLEVIARAQAGAFVQLGNSLRPRPSAASAGFSAIKEKYIFYPSSPSGSNASASISVRLFTRPRAISACRGTAIRIARSLFEPGASGQSISSGRENTQTNPATKRIQGIAVAISSAVSKPKNITRSQGVLGSPKSLAAASISIKFFYLPTAVSSANTIGSVISRRSSRPAANAVAVSSGKGVTEISVSTTRPQAMSAPRSSGSILVRMLQVRIQTIASCSSSSTLKSKGVVRGQAVTGSITSAAIVPRYSSFPTALSRSIGTGSLTSRGFVYPTARATIASSGKGIIETGSSIRPQVMSESQSLGLILVRILQIRIAVIGFLNGSTASNPKMVSRSQLVPVAPKSTGSALLAPRFLYLPMLVSASTVTGSAVSKRFSYPGASASGVASGKGVTEISANSSRPQSIGGSSSLGSILCRLFSFPIPSGISSSTAVITTGLRVGQRPHASGESRCLSSLLSRQIIRPRIFASIQGGSQMFIEFGGIAIIPPPVLNAVAAGLVGGGAVTRKGFKPSDIQDIESPQTTSGKSPIGVQPLPTPL